MFKYILGNGISAKIFAFYNPEYVRIAPKAQAQLEKKAFSGLVVVHRCKSMDHFFDDLGLEKPVPMDIPMYTFWDGEFLPHSPRGKQMELFLRKKLCGLNIPAGLFAGESKINKPYLATNWLESYQISAADIVKVLNKAIDKREIIYDTVTEITDSQLKLSDADKVLDYSYLVSTIPAPIFWEIYKGEHKENKTFYSNSLFVGNMDKQLWNSMNYPSLDMGICYFPEQKYKFDRLFFLEQINQNLVYIESSQPFSRCLEIKGARFVRSYDNFAPPGIMFLGRYAEWNPDLMMNQIVQRCIAKYALSDVWSDQKFFNKRFVHFSPDIEYVQSAVKNYILHLMSETDELLNTINWKINANDRKKVKRPDVLEEWIDIFKFWLSIGLMFGFDVSDFINMYWEKSQKVKERFK